MPSGDINSQKNIASDEEAHIEVVEEGKADTSATDVEPSEQVNEQEPVAELSDDELAIVDGGAGSHSTSLTRFAKSEFGGKTFIPGVVSLATAMGSYAVSHAVVSGKHRDSPV